MAKERRLDFVLANNTLRYEEGDIVFRFYPKSSHMHGFEEDKPPASLSEVYKVYYSWAIIHKFKNAPAEILFCIHCDECSALTDLSESIRYVLDRKTRACLMSPGQEGSIWELEFDKGLKRPKWAYRPDKIQFSVWSNLTSKGYRFWLTVDKAKAFAEYLDRVNQHMLENAEPI